MSSPVLRLVKDTPAFFRRNFGIAAPALQKATDPIQQLFLEKLREYKTKAVPGKLVDASPELEKELKNDLERVEKQFGATGQDMTSFPKLSFPEVKVEDPTN